MFRKHINYARSLYADVDTYHSLPVRERVRLWAGGATEIDAEFGARTSGKTLLDIGCGPPDARNSVAILDPSEYIGLDLFPHLHPTLASAIDHIPLADDCVDSINCISVLEHVYNPRDVLSEMYRVLRPGGCVRVQVPFLIQYHGYPDDYHRYTHYCLQRMFEDTGFHVLAIDTDWSKGVFLNAGRMLEDGSWDFDRPSLRMLSRTLGLAMYSISKKLDSSYAIGRVGMYYAIVLLAQRPEPVVDGSHDVIGDQLLDQ